MIRWDPATQQAIWASGSFGGGGSASDAPPSFQGYVLGTQVDATLDPGASPSDGDRYIIGDAANLHANFGTIDTDTDGNATTLQDDDIVEYVSSESEFRIAHDVGTDAPGAIVFDDGDDAWRVYTGDGEGAADGSHTTWRKISTGGSSGSSVSVYDVMAAPSSPSTKDDEFDDESYDTSKWTTFDPDGTGTVTEQPWGLELTAASTDAVGCYQSWTRPAAFTIDTYFAWNFTSQNYRQFGVIFFEDVANYTTTKVETFVYKAFSTNDQLSRDKSSSYGSYAGSDDTNVNYIEASGIFLRVTYDGSNYTLWWSVDGRRWQRASGLTPYISSPNAFGLYLNNAVSSTSAISASCSFFRYHTSDLGDAPVHGRRVNLSY